jgi:peptidoglycan/xylan/chitin deacetylase (PgdA/CDA1 family)
MKQLANLSLDLDNKWAYLRAAGRADWDQRGGYLPLVIPRIVDLLGEIGLPLTVFAVGRDFEKQENLAPIECFKSLKGYEFANHSYNHLPWMHTLTDTEIQFEIDQTSQVIEASLNEKPLGFRGPGFSCPATVLRVLAARGFAYDASLFPTSIAPIARAVFLMRSGLDGAQREQASKLYGGWSSAFQSNRPHQRSIDCTKLWELPVTVMPLSRTPIHFSYFTFLAGFSRIAAKAYFLKAMWMCRATGTSPSLLLHPPDFMGKEDDADMAYFPAMKMSRASKLEMVRWALKQFATSFEVVRMIDHVKALNAQTSETQSALPCQSAVAR